MTRITTTIFTTTLRVITYNQTEIIAHEHGSDNTNDDPQPH